MGLAFQLAADGVEDAFETLSLPFSESLQRLQTLELPRSPDDLERLVHQFEKICGDQLTSSGERSELH